MSFVGRTGAGRPALLAGLARLLPRALPALAVGLLAGGLLAVWGERPTEAREPASKGRRAKPQPLGRFEHGCRVQKPQPFLQRRSYVRGRVMNGAKQGEALRWLAERYGHADDGATEAFNDKPARDQSTTVRFFGLPIAMHKRVAPALACVERRIVATCGGRYQPKAIGGFRGANTYRGREVSNHLFGIAIDIDPDKNPCCGCVEPWPSHPACKDRGRSALERSALPKCWISAFERFGFDWLGHDELEDTMHFEFLGDPDRLTR